VRFAAQSASSRLFSRHAAVLPSPRVQGPFRTPAALAQALLRGAVTPERIAKLLRHARLGTRAEFEQTLAAIPDAAVRKQVANAGAARQFAG